MKTMQEKERQVEADGSEDAAGGPMRQVAVLRWGHRLKIKHRVT